MKNLFVLALLFVSNALFSQSKLSPQSQLAVADSALLVLNDGNCRALVMVNNQATEQILETCQTLVHSKAGLIWSVQFPFHRLNDLLALTCIQYMDIAHINNSFRAKNDIERQLTGVDKVQTGTANGLASDYSGKGVVVGIVDIGFQNNHPTFYNSKGTKTRVVRYWAQASKNGLAPLGFNYGTEYRDSTSILMGNDRDGVHGTHVAGIAAGSGLSTPNARYRGMAPDAELVFVSIKYANDTLGGSALGDYVIANPGIIDAYQYIFNYAQSVGKPAVINLSWGMHTGPHDGSSLFDKATEQLIGKGKVLVGANGNEGDNPMHWTHSFSGDTASTIMVENGRHERKTENVYADFWGSKNTAFKVRIRILDTNNNLIVATPFVNSNSNKLHGFSLSGDTSVFKISMACDSNNILNQKPNMTIVVNQPKTKKYCIVMDMYSVNSTVHGWNSGAARGWTSGSFRDKVGKLDYIGKFINGNSDNTCGENGGTSNAVISVGAMAARSAFVNIQGKLMNDSSYALPGQIAKFSSRGPTIDGRIKPDVSAPGYNVPSAINNLEMEGWMTDRTLLKTGFRGDTSYWVALSGTSMASPHVCGIVALMLEANPNMTATQVKAVLQQTANANSFTGTLPNNTYGYGIVNAFEAVKKAVQMAGVNSLNNSSDINVYPNPAENQLSIDFGFIPTDVNYTIVAADGKQVLKGDHNNAGGSQMLIDISVIESGFYVLTVEQGGQFYAFKFLKR
ncbi:MAG: S8 family peptidase [Bacteroidota bacterium]